MANARDWRVGVNLIGLTNFISTVIGPNLTSCHLKLILVTPLGSKTRKLGAFGSYIPTDSSKTGLERNLFQFQNLQPWNTECVESGALEGGLIFVAFSLEMKYFSRLVVVVELKSTGYHLALAFTVLSFRSRAWSKTMPNLKNFLEHSDQADLLHRGLQGLRWKLDACALWKKSIPVAQDLLVMDLELCLPAWILYPG